MDQSKMSQEGTGLEVGGGKVRGLRVTVSENDEAKDGTHGRFNVPKGNEGNLED